MVGLHTLQFLTVTTVICHITHSAMRLLYSNLFSRSFTLSSSSAASWQKCSKVKSAVRAGFLEGGVEIGLKVIYESLRGFKGIWG